MGICDVVAVSASGGPPEDRIVCTNILSSALCIPEDGSPIVVHIGRTGSPSLGGCGCQGEWLYGGVNIPWSSPDIRSPWVNGPTKHQW